MSKRILVVDLEPTHYKTDLWNAFADSGKVVVKVVFTERRNWSPDAGHDYQRFPADRFESVVLEGKGLAGSLRSAWCVLRLIQRTAPELIYIAGYVHLQTIIAVVYAALLGKRFVVHADIFNNGRPEGRIPWAKWVLRESLRRLIFARAEAVLVCGRLGLDTARVAGCPQEKIRDFPYSVSLARIQGDLPAEIPGHCADDLRSGKRIVMFSGRMIPRKGLTTLVEAMATLIGIPDWTLWIEGAGPELEVYVDRANRLGLGERCRFLGFCQYDLHSWLMRSADIVVVPSFEDTWGIVVDEGLQLGKAVISSDATGSGRDRIEHGQNGYIFPAGEVRVLAALIESLLSDSELRARVGQAARGSARNVRPEDNVKTMLKMMDRTQ